MIFGPNFNKLFLALAITIPVAFAIWWVLLWGVVRVVRAGSLRWYVMPVVVILEWAAGFAAGLIGYRLVAPYEPDLSLTVGLTLIGTAAAATSVLFFRLLATPDWSRAATASFVHWMLAAPASCGAFYLIILALPD
ncbi:MAG: hypothetical protein ABL982_16300 [Vicinamibacterales bacterium]